jgi:heme/copper-type cytochrome/quinol oxidase subunit 3
LVFLVHLGPDTSFGSTYLLLTGTHWLAAALCVGWFTYVVADVRKRDALAAAMYSHFLNLWWLVLVVTLYLMNFTFDGL